MGRINAVPPAFTLGVSQIPFWLFKRRWLGKKFANQIANPYAAQARYWAIQARIVGRANAKPDHTVGYWAGEASTRS